MVGEHTIQWLKQLLKSGRNENNQMGNIGFCPVNGIIRKFNILTLEDIELLRKLIGKATWHGFRIISGPDTYLPERNPIDHRN